MGWPQIPRFLINLEVNVLRHKPSPGVSTAPMPEDTEVAVIHPQGVGSQVCTGLSP